MKGNSAGPRVGRFFWIIVLVVGLSAAYFVFRKNEARPGSSAEIPSSGGNAVASAPGFTLTDLEGRPVSLSDFRGKVVVLDFWATWCPPCKREIPDFVGLQSTYGSRGVQIVGIALDEPARTKAFAVANRMNYPVLLGNEEVSSQYGGISGIPTTFVLDRNGKIFRRYIGFRPRDVFEADIRQLL
jgi:cytochrome c biogenesis protein CcmG/thiol:disulfide interchange protein DsbE